MPATLYVITSTEVLKVGGTTLRPPSPVRVAIGVKFTPAGWGVVKVTVLYPDADDDTDGVI